MVDTVNRTVLVVEDDPGFGNLLVDVLKAAGHTAELAATSGEALAALKDAVPDVLCVDIDLPDGTGWELLDELKRRSIEVPRVIVATAGMGASQSHKRPGTFLLPKPFPIDSLLRLVRGDEIPEM